MATSRKLVRKIILSVALLAVSSWATSVSAPAAPVPAARFATGITYNYLGGYLYKAPVEDLAFNTHGINAFFTYAPLTSINLGVDLGMRDVNMEKGIYGFNGRFGIAAGSHLKFATPYFGDVMGLVAMCRGLWFYSEDQFNTYYSGRELTSAGGLSFHVQRVGYISFGAKYLEIFGENGYGLEKGKWSNDATLGGWIAFDFFPRTDIKQYIPFISFEFGFFPNDKPFYGGNPVLRNASFGITIGGITRRLYGNTDENWRP